MQQLQIILTGAAVAILLILLVLWLTQRRPSRPRLRVLAHRGFFMTPANAKPDDPKPPQGPHWFVKVTNAGSEPVTITHVGARCGSYVPALGMRLPVKIPPQQTFETWVSESDLLDAIESAVIETGAFFEVRDHLGGFHKSKLNKDVAPAGHVAQI